MADFTRCRTIGHAWFDVDSDWKPILGVPLTLRCERCMMERRDTISRSTGEVLSRRYTYPQGYQYRNGDGVPSKADFRLMLIAQRVAERRGKRSA